MVHVISRKRLLDAANKHRELSGPLDAWYRIAKSARWKSWEGIRSTFPAADGVGKYTIFNLKGNNYRLITEINYAGQRVYIRFVLTHAEYDKGAWKQ